jgi:cellulose synthase/poly-beta-1,6-N-acetylglucosamine synthase-like glycosyltransferase
MNAVAWVLVTSPVAVALYAYVVYPALLAVLGRHDPVGVASWSEWPLVTIIVPAYNEEKQIAGAIEALLAQDYPPDRRQILVLSDGSTDQTDSIVSGYAARGVELLRMPVRSGKTAAENAACQRIRGDIVINSDASIRLHPSAVRNLVTHMSDPGVGVASSCDVSVALAGVAGNTTEAGYVGYEMKVRALETRTGGIVGASGSGYAIRTKLHLLPVRADLSRDFSAALTARTHGFRAVSVNDAVCYVPRTGSLRAEYRRKVRTIRRGMETLIHNRHLLNPFRFGMFSWKLISHKILRWTMPALAIPAAIGLVILAREFVWARYALGGGLIAIAVATLGAMWPEERPMPRLISVIAFGVAANLAVVHALLRVILHQRQDSLWEPTRR